MARLGWMLFLFLALTARPVLGVFCEQERALPLAVPSATAPPVTASPGLGEAPLLRKSPQFGETRLFGESPQEIIAEEAMRLCGPVQRFQVKAKTHLLLNLFGSEGPRSTPDDFLTLPSLQVHKSRGKICNSPIAGLLWLLPRNPSYDEACRTLSEQAGPCLSARDRLHLLCVLHC